MSVNFDDILKTVGQFGRFQKYIIFLIAVPCMISCWQSFLHAFIGFIPRHRCEIEHCDNETTSFNPDWLNNTVPGKIKNGHWRPSSCQKYVFQNSSDPSFCMEKVSYFNATEKCSRWKYDTSDFSSTIATEWELVCGKEPLVSFAGTVNLAGGFLGYVLMGFLSDRYGRKVGILCCLTFIVIFGTASALAPNLYVFMVMRFFIETMESSLYQLLFVLVTEFLGPDKRVIGAQIVQLIYSMGEMLLAGLAYFFNSWRALQLVTTLPAIFFLSFYWLLPESARWLLANKKEEKANAIIEKMARWNKTTISQEMVSRYGSFTDENSVNTDVESKDIAALTDITAQHHSSLDLFRTPRLRKRTLVIMMNWLLNVLVYNGITLNATAIPGFSAQLSFFLTGLVEIPANLLSIVTMNRLGRRITLSAAFVITGIPLVIIQFLPSDPEHVWIIVTMTLIGKFGSTIGNAALYLFSAELFPTVIRNSGMGVCGLVGTFASSIAPQITLFGQFEEALPYVIFGTLSFFGGLFSLILPETLNQRIPETIEDAENFGK